MTEKKSTATNEAWFERAQKSLVGGVNSPVRAFRAVGGTPRFFVRGEGAYLEDVEGRRYADYVMSWGPLILGHAHPAVVRAVAETAARGTSFGAPSPLEVELAEAVKDFFPNIEKVRFVSSGTEATMTALRLARGVTGRDRAIKFAGGYHGHGDPFLVSAGSGALTLGIPSSPGIPADAAASTLVLPYNDLAAVETAFAREGDRIAAVIVEPWAGNMGLIPPEPGFLEGLRAACDRHGALLIFDEVITGFRIPEGGVQNRIGLRPDLTCLGKVVGGGLPVGALGGGAALMGHLAPEGPVYQAGTLSGNPVAMAAGLATLTELRRPSLYDDLDRLAERLRSGLLSAADRAGVPLSVSRLGSVLGIFFSPSVPRNLEEVKTTRGDLYPAFFHGMLDRGHYFAPSAFEAAFVGAAHGTVTIDTTVAAAEEVFRELAPKR
jgi:glutamate-1-semialdehyde 2,1-aminomutase